MELENNTTCSVCQSVISGNYCNNCGQKIGLKPTTVISMVSDICSNIFSLEQSVFATILKLLKFPQLLIVNYWNGNRKYYSSPGKMLFYALTFAALHIQFINPKILGLQFEVVDLQAQLLFWILFFPILLLTSYLTFIRRKLGLTKHIISVLYLSSSFFIVITIVNALLIKFYKDVFGVNVFIAFILMLFIWNAIVHTTNRSYIKVTLNVVLELIIFMVICTVLLYVLYLTNPGSISLTTTEN